jgi:hypothetical protein
MMGQALLPLKNFAMLMVMFVISSACVDGGLDNTVSHTNA